MLGLFFTVVTIIIFISSFIKNDKIGMLLAFIVILMKYGALYIESIT